jgi:methylated-DNA-[protein]-cysteine S-methyltransferase
VSDFKNRVLKIVSEIPKGKILSYKQIAELAGSPRAYRAVGNIMASNNNPNVPCHRVIKSDGSIGGYSGKDGVPGKIKILEKEGAI